MPDSRLTNDFMETLPFRGRLLVSRLESFGDIVVGFSMSQLALQLGLPKQPEDLVTDPLRYALFFFTFSIIAVTWLRYHRILTSGFAPHRIDLALAFAYLAFTALLPYALYANARVSHVAGGSRYGVAAYTICLLGTSAASFVLAIRSIARSKDVLSDVEFLRLHQRAYIEGGITAILAGGLALDIFIGTRTSPVFMLIPVWVAVVRRRMKAANWSDVHVHGTESAPVNP